jgi:hypothetical protein
MAVAIIAPRNIVKKKLLIGGGSTSKLSQGSFYMDTST